MTRDEAFEFNRICNAIGAVEHARRLGVTADRYKSLLKQADALTVVRYAKPINIEAAELEMRKRAEAKAKNG